MISYRLTECAECTTIPALLADIDCKVTEFAKKQYNDIVFALNSPISFITMSDLLHYKRILECKTCNADYASCYTIEQISSKIKILIHK